MLKRSNGVHDLTALPLSLNFDLHVTVVLAYAPTAPPVPLVVESLQTFRQLKYSLRHVLPVDCDDPRVKWSLLRADENAYDEPQSEMSSSVAAHDQDLRNRYSTADSAMELSSALSSPSRPLKEIQEAEPTAAATTEQLERNRDYDQVYEVLQDGDMLIVDLVSVVEA